MDWISGDSALWVLFSTGFLSATLLPGGSEANLIYLLKQSDYGIAILVMVATLGNTLGGMTNYWIGRFIPARTLNQKHGQRAISWLQRYGYWTLLLSWLPIIGDPLCLAAGWLRLKQRWCWILIAIGKALRYLILALVTRGLLF
ncbi:membrane protein [Grimontia sp. AD028]|uniref:Inner membrane protein YqaA n=2 Tax=Grimontia TaxID=246861 RepID=A0A128EWP7_9GAMM|nr:MULTISPECIES: YqaA family protein [Grimontia]KKD61090.1 membrane protein [Grimontia sp. AD028]USH02967.1 DedA family protein [Grimontia kaedaensis]CZF78604.1 Inner membrane protein YqaA [Grimontia marina]